MGDFSSFYVICDCDIDEFSFSSRFYFIFIYIFVKNGNIEGHVGVDTFQFVFTLKVCRSLN